MPWYALKKYARPCSLSRRHIGKAAAVKTSCPKIGASGDYRVLFLLPRLCSEPQMKDETLVCAFYLKYLMGWYHSDHHTELESLRLVNVRWENYLNKRKKNSSMGMRLICTLWNEHLYSATFLTGATLCILLYFFFFFFFFFFANDSISNMILISTRTN